MSIRKRLPTAFLILAVVFCCIQFLPRIGFFCAIQIVILIALFELYKLVQKKKLYPQKTLGIVLALTVSLSFLFDKFSLPLALYLCLLISAGYYIFAIRNIEDLVRFPQSIAVTFFGAFFMSFTLNHIFFIREERGPFFIYFLLAVIALGDTGAYSVGKLLGRRKMVPMASPKKTWEGSFGGILLASAAALAVQILLLKDIAVWKVVVSGVMIHAIAQLSDPFESLFKRAAGTKDSSNILPGHGGFLDRIDSLILAAPFFYYLMKFFWDRT